MATVYDEFLGSRGDLKYIDNPSIEYPGVEENTVLGTTLLPRVYGKDLQAFEIASSGIVAVSLDDVHSFDLTRNSAESNVILSTLCNDSFEINVNDSNVTMKADGVNNDLSFFTLRDMNTQSDRSLNMTANSNVQVVGQQDVDITASNNASFQAVNDMSLSSTTFSNNVSSDYATEVGGNMQIALSNDLYVSGVSMSNTFSDTVTIQAGQNFVASGDNSAMMASLGRVEINGVDNSMSIIMGDESLVFRTHTDHEFFATSSNEYRIATSNDFVVIAKDQISLDSMNMSNVVGQDYATEVGRDMTINVASNVNMSSTTMSNTMSQDYKTEVGRNMTQYVETDLDMTSTTMSNLVKDSYNLNVGNDMISSASNTVEFTAKQGSFNVQAHEGAMAFSLDHNTDTARIESVNNITVGASNDMTTTVERDMSTSVTGNVDLSATTMSNVLSEDYKTEVGRNMTVNVTGDVNMSNSTLSNVTDGNYTLEIGQDMKVVAASNIYQTAENGSYELSVNSGAMTMNMDDETNDMNIHVDHDFITSASNDTFMDTKKNVMVRSKDDANNLMHYMQFQSDNQINFSTTGTYSFNIRDGINGTPQEILTMDPENVFVKGNLNVSGVVNSTGIVENRLEVEDKTLYLATNSNFVDSLDGPIENIAYEEDGVTNDGAGVRVHGFPSNAVIPDGKYQHDVAHLYEKSFAWNHRTTGVMGLGGDKPTEEARWELKGGALYLTNQRVDSNGELVNTTSFGFRINQRDELEMIKEYKPVSGTSFTRRIAKFGFNL